MPNYVGENVVGNMRKVMKHFPIAGIKVDIVTIRIYILSATYISTVIK